MFSSPPTAASANAAPRPASSVPYHADDLLREANGDEGAPRPDGDDPGDYRIVPY
jgi:hypothetical protein